MFLRCLQDVEQELSCDQILIPYLSNEGGVRFHLSAFEHEIFAHHFEECRSLLRVDAYGCGLPREFLRIVDGDAA